MELWEELLAKKEAVFARWRERIFDSYASETARFLRREKDRFANPVAYQLSRGLRLILEAFCRQAEVEELAAALDEVIQLQAVQAESPARALAFLLLLKRVIREELPEVYADPANAAAVVDLEERIDGLTLIGFDVYMQRREKLFQIRVAEIQRGVSGLLRRLGLGAEYPAEPVEP